MNLKVMDVIVELGEEVNEGTCEVCGDDAAFELLINGNPAGYVCGFHSIGIPMSMDGYPDFEDEWWR